MSTLKSELQEAQYFLAVITICVIVAGGWGFAHWMHDAGAGAFMASVLTLACIGLANWVNS